MHSKKKVGQEWTPSGTPALTGYSCEDFCTEPAEAAYY